MTQKAFELFPALSYYVLIIFSSSSRLQLGPLSTPLPICLKRLSMKDTHVPLWIKSGLLGRSDVGVYSSLISGRQWRCCCECVWGVGVAVVSGKIACSYLPWFTLSLRPVSQDKHLKLHTFICTCRLHAVQLQQNLLSQHYSLLPPLLLLDKVSWGEIYIKLCLWITQKAAPP